MTIDQTRPVVCGVYFLFLDQKLIYVGRSRDAYRRIDAHRKNGREFGYAIVAGCLDYDAAWVEASLIRAMEARQNRTHQFRTPPAATVDHVATAPDIPTDPQKMVSLCRARVVAREYRLRAALDAAIEDGSLSAFNLHGKVGRGARRAIFAGDLRKWIDSRQDDRRRPDRTHREQRV